MPQQVCYSFGFLPCGDEQAAADLVEQTFLAQVAPLFPPEGVNEFLSHVNAQVISQRLQASNFMLTAYGPQGLIGVLEANVEQGHIVWFFVKEEQQGRGVGRELLTKALAELKRRKPQLGRITVNSSPNSVDTYLSLGFIPTDLQQERNGIRFTPMEYLLG